MDEILKTIQNETSSLVINSGISVVLKLATIVNNKISNDRIMATARKVSQRIKMYFLLVSLLNRNDFTLLISYFCN